MCKKKGVLGVGRGYRETLFDLLVFQNAQDLGENNSSEFFHVENVVLCVCCVSNM